MLIRNMFLRTLTILLALVYSNSGFTQEFSSRIANYDMEIFLDTEQKMLKGKTKLLFKNPSEDLINELQFHLYYNAFKDTRSTFMQGNRFNLFNSNEDDVCKWAYSRILKMTDENGSELMTNATFIAPDDGNPYDQTVLKVPLQFPLGVGDSIVIDFEWEAKIPKAMIRTGYNQDFYFLAQWFPKLGVYEPAGTRYQKKGAWNCHQYHALGEYYGEFGNYRVALNVPEGFVVGASGSMTNNEAVDDREIFTFEIEDVIDFTWTASPHYEVVERDWNHVNIKLYKYPGHEKYVDRYFEAVTNSLEFMTKNVGAYPYKTLSIIDPPIHGIFTGGMEYPTLISSISLSFLPKGVKAPETLVVHEFVHQYFMQMVATHEQEEPWMDEGITSYYESRILDEYYGEKTSFAEVLKYSLGNSEYNRIEFWQSDNPKIASNSYKARDFVHGGYGVVAYNKAAMMLRTLENILGKEVFDTAMKNYFETWKFGHPCGRDFIQSMKESIDPVYLAEKQLNLNQFFNQALYGTEICDYAVASIRNIEFEQEKGYLNDFENCITEDSEKDGLYESKVIIHRLGEMILPIEIFVKFDDGSDYTFTWNGNERTTEYSRVSESKIIEIQLDPKRKLDLEANLINNSRQLNPNKSFKKYSSKFKLSLQHFLDFLNVLS